MYYNTQYYDGVLGRFISSDSIGQGILNPQSHNRYSYGLNSPLNFTDPTGHKNSPPNCYGIPDCGIFENTKAPDTPLTHAGNPDPYSDNGGTISIGGAEVLALYNSYNATPGWWNNYTAGALTLEAFVGMWALFEGSGYETMATIIATVIAQNLYVGGDRPAYMHASELL